MGTAMIDRSDRTIPAVRAWLETEHRKSHSDCSCRIDFVVEHGVGTTFRVHTGWRPQTVTISMELLQDEEPDELLARLRRGNVVERMGREDSLRVTSTGVESDATRSPSS
jgi:hypothetical protein